MSSLRRDLVERKLWMVVALLVVAVVAVPVFLLKSASANTAPTVPAPPSAAPAGAQTSTTENVDTKKESPKVVLARIARNPFASAVPKLKAKPAPTTSSSSTTSTTATTSSPSTSTVAMVSPAPSSSGTTSSSGSTSTSPSTGSSSSGTARTPTAGNTPTSTIASTPPATQSAQPAKVQTWTMYSVDVRFGNDLHVPLRADIARLTALPSAKQPDVMFDGVMSNGNAAVFALRQGVGHTGPGWCHPDHDTCSAIVLKPGETEDLTIPGPGGTLQKRMLRVVRITSSITHSQKAALAAFNRVSHPGLCDLLLAEPLIYHLDTGTYTSVPKKTACANYPDAVPFTYFRTAP